MNNGVMTDQPAETDDPLIEWVEESTGLDRILSILLTTDPGESYTAPELADEAKVSPNTARTHLNRLQRLFIVEKEEAGQTTLYRPAPDYLKFYSIKLALEDLDDEEAIHDKLDALDERANGIKREHGTSDPSELYEQAEATDDTEKLVELRKAGSVARHIQSERQALLTALNNDLITV